MTGFEGGICIPIQGLFGYQQSYISVEDSKLLISESSSALIFPFLQSHNNYSFYPT